MNNPTKLTKVVQDNLVEHVQAGCTLKVACGACGIDPGTLRRWMIEAKDPANKRQRTLRAALKKAKHTLEASCLRRINLASIEPKNWTAAAWLLQHRVGGSYLKTAAAINKPQVSVTMADQARRLAEAEAQLDAEEDDA
jgi:hypothetical protein